MVTFEDGELSASTVTCLTSEQGSRDVFHFYLSAYNVALANYSWMGDRGREEEELSVG